MDSRMKDGVHLVRLDRGEDVLAVLTGYCERRSIGSGSVQGIGAVENVVVGAWVRSRNLYEKVRLDGEWELLSFQGTVAMLDAKPFVHPHVVLGNAGAEVRGGHLFGATIAVTGEFTIRESGIAVSRRMVDEVGLKLYHFDEPDDSDE